MRTTLDIDEDVLAAARELANRTGTSMGKVLSELARRSLTQGSDVKTRNGVPLFPRQADGTVVTMEMVNQLRDEVP